MSNGSAAYGLLGVYVVYQHIYCTDIIVLFPLEVLFFPEELYLLGILCLLEVEETYLFLAEFIPCFSKEVVGASMAETATSKQSTMHDLKDLR